MTLTSIIRKAPSTEALVRVYKTQMVLNAPAARLLSLHPGEQVAVCVDKDAQASGRTRLYIGKAESGDVFPITAEDESAFTAQIIVPIVASGDCLGAVILLSNEAGCVMEGPAVKLARLTADIIANQFE